MCVCVCVCVFVCILYALYPIFLRFGINEVGRYELMRARVATLGITGACSSVWYIYKERY